MSDVRRNSAMRSVLAVTIAAAMCPAVPVVAAADETSTSAEGLTLAESDVAGEPIVDWTAWGTCEWMIDSAGGFVIRPANGADEGYVYGCYGWSVPWRDSRASIKSVRFEKTCKVYPDSSGRTVCDLWFYGCGKLEKADLTGLDTSKVTSMGQLFAECSSLTEVDLSGLDTSKVTMMDWMFMHCLSLAEVDLTGLDVSNVTNMDAMFGYCTSLTSIDLSGLDTGNVGTMDHMFFGCSSLTSLDLSGLNVGNMNDATAMFYNCTSLASLDLSGWDTSHINEMASMFEGCDSLRSISLGDKFSFAGRGEDRLCNLPWGLSGGWVSAADGAIYPNDGIPNNVAATYHAAFPDVDYSQWYADGVTFCAEKGLITGYTSGEDAGKFGVGRTLTRAQLAAILWRNAEPEAAEAYDGDATNATGMGDVADNQWYTGAANWAVKNEVINGFGGVEFRPDAPVTAEQLATILANYADRAGAEGADLGLLSGFADADSISDWARGSVAWAKAKDIINGYDENGVRYLKPYEEIARERVATILMNAFESGVLK